MKKERAMMAGGLLLAGLAIGVGAALAARSTLMAGAGPALLSKAYAETGIAAQAAQAKPTKAPKPTKVPKPTKAPKPTSTPRAAKAAPTATPTATSRPAATAAPTATARPVDTATLTPRDVPTPTAPAASSGNDPLAQGKLVFEKTAGGVGCAYCHGLDGKGKGGAGLDAANVRGADLARVRTALAGGVPLMGFIKLTEPEIQAVAAYLAYLGQQPP